MATLNKTRKATRIANIEEEKTVNMEGALAFKMDAKSRLIERSVGAFWNEDLFYAKGSTIAADLVADIAAVAATDPKFVLQLAAWARNELYLRTTPQVLLTEAANIQACKPFVREYTPKIVRRADELAEVIAHQLSTHGKPIPNSLKKGLADAFSKFDEYQLNKYDSSKSAVSLGDVLHLIYRKEGYPVSKALWNYLVNDVVDAEALPKIGALKQLLSSGKTLDADAMALIKKSNATWETVVSHFGSTKEVWESVIPNMGYMALLRNLRNFEQKDVDLAPVIARITDEEQVKRSKQLPFRFYSAYNQVTNQRLKRAIAKAFDLSLTNVTIDGNTAVLVDLSGSMGSRLSEHSTVSYKEISSVLGAIAARKSDESVVIGFADIAREININPDDTLTTNVETIRNTHVGSSTNAWLAFEALGNRKFDRIILISDMQCYDSTGGLNFYYGYSRIKPKSVFEVWNKYKQANPSAYLYSLDLSAYGTSQVPTFDNRAVTINGWSDKILDFINLSEKRNVMEAQIKKY